MTGGKIKARGERGSWFAEVAGERLPCVHAYWIKGNKHRDPGFDASKPQWQELLAAISKKRKVIVTNDVRIESGGFQRTGYVAAFAVDEIRTDDGCLTFNLVERLLELK